MKFTDRSLAKLSLETGRKDRIVFADDPRQLGVRVTTTGRLVFLAQWTHPTTKRKVRERIGEYGPVTIEDAKARARDLVGRVARGVDPRAEREAATVADKAARAEDKLTLETLISSWGRRHLSNRRERYAEEAQRALRYAFGDHLRKAAVRLTRAEVVKALDALATSGKGTTADRTKAYGRACYGWAIGREMLAANPFEGVSAFSDDVSRDRVLTDGELVEIAAASAAMSYPWGPFYRLALLTLQRRDEVAGMRWSELASDLSLWTIPGERMKNGKPHDEQLAEPVRAILRSIPRIAKRDLVFTTTGTTPISGFSRAKAALDTALMKVRSKAAAGTGHEPVALNPWRLHDFRRTGVSTMAALGIDSIVADKILAHKPAKLKGVAAVYQRHEFAKERRVALEAWAAHVASVSSASNVVTMRRA